MSHLARIWACCVFDGIARRSLGVVFVGGTILNLINQGDALPGGINFAEIVSTFALLYCVSIYGAVSNRLAAAQPEERQSPVVATPRR